MKRECAECDGEGCITETVRGGRFNMRDEQWEPLEEARVCPECNGKQTLEKPAHPNLYNLSPFYQQQKLRREYKRSTKNTVILALLRAA